MAFGFFGKGRNRRDDPGPAKEPASIGGYRVFDAGVDAARFAATLARGWDLKWPKDSENPVGPEKLREWLETYDTESAMEISYLVDEQDGSVATYDDQVEDDGLDEDSIEWIARSVNAD